MLIFLFILLELIIKLLASIENLFDFDTVKGHFASILKYLLKLDLIVSDKQYSGRVSIVYGAQRCRHVYE